MTTPTTSSGLSVSESADHQKSLAINVRFALKFIEAYDKQHMNRTIYNYARRRSGQVQSGDGFYRQHGQKRHGSSGLRYSQTINQDVIRWEVERKGMTNKALLPEIREEYQEDLKLRSNANNYLFAVSDRSFSDVHKRCQCLSEVAQKTWEGIQALVTTDKQAIEMFAKEMEKQSPGYR